MCPNYIKYTSRNNWIVYSVHGRWKTNYVQAIVYTMFATQMFNGVIIIGI